MIYRIKQELLNIYINYYFSPKTIFYEKQKWN